MATAIRLTDRGVLKVGGADRVSFLQGLVSNDVAKVAPDRAVFAAFLTPQGKFLHDFVIVDGGDALWLEMDAAALPDLLRRLRPYRLRAKVEMADASAALAVGAVIGSDALAAASLEGAAPGTAMARNGAVLLVDPRLAALGLRVIAPPDLLDGALDALAASRGTLEDYDSHRLALGVPDARRDLEVEKSTLLEADYDTLHAIAWDKGCYMGQELTARTKYRGLLKRKLVAVELDGGLPEPGTPVMQGEKRVGEIRSGRGRRAIALMKLEALDAADLTAGDSSVRPVMGE
ncbi:MAG: folate-binding protein YgfZ [Rhodospirillaceae bacterium]|nr:folate-binding protein YgfZ [Rhodospirillaceae bacterium]